MALGPGTKLGAFEIAGLLGKGGMGEVYRARDTKLGREVAIKVLPEALAADEEYLVRFEREAKVLASLDHSNIATIYDFIGAGADGVHHFLVMQLVEGETLADRIGRGPLVPDEAIHIFSQIADGLEAAHERGVIHRDLKPANIKITHEGRVKLLDFGIAKSTEGFATPGAATPKPNTPSGEGDATKPMSTTPTAFATGPGRFIGTPQYMSPEQARGKPVDKRTDIWAFGVCLYEALTGAPPFGGESATDLVAAIVRDEPDLELLPASTPAHLRALLCRCLEKNPRFRLRDIGEAWYVLNHPPEAAAPPAAIRVTQNPTGRFSIALPEGLRLSTLMIPMSISDDGSVIVLLAYQENVRKIYVRRLEDPDIRPLPGTERAAHPFLSPDGKWVGFFQGLDMKKTPASGGPVQSIATCTDRPLGGYWLPDGSILWSEFDSGIFRIDAAGGTKVVIAAPDREAGELWLAVNGRLTSDGKWVGIASVFPDPDRHSVLEALCLADGRRSKLVGSVTQGTLLPSGHFVYARLNRLFASRYSGDSPQLAGHSIEVLDGVRTAQNAPLAVFNVSMNGTLIYVPVLKTGDAKALFWVTRGGERTEIKAGQRGYASPRVSPDGELLALVGQDPESHYQIYIYEIRRGVLEKLTSDTLYNVAPVWRPNSDSLTFSQAAQMPAMHAFSLERGVSELIQTPEFGESPSSYSPDGRFLVYTLHRSAIHMEIWVRSDDGAKEVFVDTRACNFCGKFDPAGEYIAYVSNESGRFEIYIKPFGRPGRRVQLSVEGGSDPVWAPDGGELFYRNGDTVMAVTIEREGRIRAAQPRTLFDFPFGARVSFYAPSFDIHPDGQRFVMTETVAEPRGATEFMVVTNWFDELNRLLPPEGP